MAPNRVYFPNYCLIVKTLILLKVRSIGFCQFAAVKKKNKSLKRKQLSQKKRFIDHVLFIYSNSEKNFKRFLKDIIGFQASIKSNFEKLKMKVNFLDVVTKIKNGRLSTDLCFKPVDSYQYLHYNSWYAEHIKNLSFAVKF